MGALNMSPALSTSALRGRWLLRQHAFGAAGGVCAAVTASVLQPQLRGCSISMQVSSVMTSRLPVYEKEEVLRAFSAGAAALEKEAERLDTDLGPSQTRRTSRRAKS